MTYSVNFANYTIGEDAYQNVREVCRHYGKKALLIGGELALKAGKEKLIQALASEIQIVDTVLFGTDCTYARMEELAEHAKKCGADVTIVEKTDLMLGLGNVGGIMRNNGRFTAAEENIALGASELFELTDKYSRHRNIDFPGHSHASLYDVVKVEPAVRRLLLAAGAQARRQRRRQQQGNDTLFHASSPLSASGRYTVNTVPTPFAPWPAEMVPPRFSMVSFTMDSPSPVPPTSRERILSTR